MARESRQRQIYQRFPGFRGNSGTFLPSDGLKNIVNRTGESSLWRPKMHGIIYLVGLVVVILAILSFFGLR
jgi:hypothetical protein